MFKVNYRSEAGLYHPVQRGSKQDRRVPSVTSASRLSPPPSASRLSSSPAISWPASLWKSAMTAMTPGKFASYMTPTHIRWRDTTRDPE